MNPILLVRNPLAYTTCPRCHYNYFVDSPHEKGECDWAISDAAYRARGLVPVLKGESSIIPSLESLGAPIYRDAWDVIYLPESLVNLVFEFRKLLKLHHEYVNRILRVAARDREFASAALGVIKLSKNKTEAVKLVKNLLRTWKS